MALLEVNNLQVAFRTRSGTVNAVRGIDFAVERSQMLGIVGESGSGKSVTALSLLRLNDERHTTYGTNSRAAFAGADVLRMTGRQIRSIRGNKISMIFQDPLTSLDPVMSVGAQIVETIRVHEPSITRSDARQRAIEALDMVRIPRPTQRVDQYPHQLSGGMRQRVMIAMAIASHPDLLIADEPTTALDVTVQASIMELLDTLRQDLNMAVVLITHDLQLVRDRSDQILVMYQGLPVEYRPTASLFVSPSSPYTRALLESAPSVLRSRGDGWHPITAEKRREIDESVAQGVLTS